MKYLPLIWRNLLRRKVRTIFTLASVFIAFVLYGFLMVVQNAFSMGVDVAGADRLVLMHKVSLIQLLPISYQQQIGSTPGVTHVSNASWLAKMAPRVLHSSAGKSPTLRRSTGSRPGWSKPVYP